MKALFFISKVLGGSLFFIGLVLFMGTVGAYEIGTIGTLYFIKHLAIYALPLAVGFIVFTVAAGEEENYVF